jgi:S-adenosylmethionine uptake transporter
MSLAQPHASQTTAVLVSLLAVFFLAAMDASMKSLVLAIGVFNTVLWRSWLAAIVIGAGWTATAKTRPSRSVLKLHFLRAAVVAAVLILFFWGLARLPLAEAIALSFVAPLIALGMAAALLGERISKHAIWASIAGIAGVSIIIAGQIGQEAYSQEAAKGAAAILASTVFYAYNLILVRQQALVAKPLEISFFQNLFVALLMTLAAPWLAAMMPSELWPLLIGVTVLSIAGQMLMSWAYARAEAQYLIPAEYSAFIWAIALGWLCFNEAVTWPTIAGAVLIIASCIVATRAKPGLAEPIEAVGV